MQSGLCYREEVVCVRTWTPLYIYGASMYIVCCVLPGGGGVCTFLRLKFALLTCARLAFPVDNNPCEIRRLTPVIQG
jgi:hypothetical protein